MINMEMLLKIAERYGIEVKKVDPGKGGLVCDGERINGEAVEKIMLNGFGYQNISSPAFEFILFYAKETNLAA
ncbi:MAG TPA: hypothetical protein VM577_02390 [Anaerovoracaceae bacterium]|nr:hypothetical protein [Anaerovoracaceae bacterium]